MLVAAKTEMCVCVGVQSPDTIGALQSPYREGAS